jgi:uncharacterized protein (DUF58 family)
MGELVLPGEIAYWAGFAVGVALAAYLVILIARRAKKPKKKAEVNNQEERAEVNNQEERAEVNNQDELLNRRVAETIKQVESDIPEPLRPYLVYRGPVPERLNAKWFPRELTIEAPGQEPQRVEVYQDSLGFLYVRIDKAK